MYDQNTVYPTPMFSMDTGSLDLSVPGRTQPDFSSLSNDDDTYYVEPPMFNEQPPMNNGKGKNNVEMEVVNNNREIISYVFNKIRTFEINSHSNYGKLVTDLKERVNIVQKSLPSNLRLLLDKAIANTLQRHPEMKDDEKFIQDQETVKSSLDNLQTTLDVLAQKHQALNNKYSYEDNKQLYDSFYNKVRYNLSNEKIQEIINTIEGGINNNNLNLTSIGYTMSKILMSIFVEIDIDLAKFVILNKDIFYEEKVTTSSVSTDFDSVTQSSIDDFSDDIMGPLQKILSTEIIIPNELAVKMITIFNYILFIILYNSNNIDFVRFFIFIIAAASLSGKKMDDKITESISVLKEFLLDTEPYTTFTIGGLLDGLIEPVMEVASSGNFVINDNPIPVDDTLPPATTPFVVPEITEGFSAVGKKWYMILLYIILIIGVLYAGYYYGTK
jgi:hypothetical protein